MQQPIAEAIKEAGLDYTQFVAYCVSMDLHYNEYTPTVDPIYVAAIKAQVQAQRGRPKEQQLVPATVEAAPVKVIDLSDSALKVLVKMARRFFFGDHHVLVESLQNTFCKRVKDVPGACKELEKAGLLQFNSSHGNEAGCSLVVKRSRDIEEYLKAYDQLKGAA